jgi:hypothetical protein
VSAKVAASDAHRGMSLHVVSDTADLTERADQSTWPAVERDENGDLHVARGPHNIVRRVIEFAIEHPRVDVYLGSPAEIVATMHAVARDELDAADLLFNDDPSRLMVWQRPTTAADAAELVATAASLGLDISERTAHRVLSGELDSVATVMGTLTRSVPQRQAEEPDIYKDRRGLRIAQDDLARFANDLTTAFDDLAERYYLHLRGEPRIIVGRDEIRVRFSVDKDD